MNSLQDLALSTFSLQELESLTTGPYRHSLGEISQWYLWRRRAQEDYGTDPSFFDLASLSKRGISGRQRYIEVSSYYRLTPDSLIRVSPEGTLLGVYERVAGYLEAWARDDQESQLIFAPLSTEEKKYIDSHLEEPSQFYDLPRNSPIYRQLYISLRRGDEEAFALLERDQSLERRFLLSETLKSGSSLLFERLIVTYLPQLGENFQLDRVIAKLPFQPFQSQFPLLDLGFFLNEGQSISVFGLSLGEIFSSAVYGCNCQIVDFFRALFRQKYLRRIYNSFYPGLTFHSRPVEALSIFQRQEPQRVIDELLDEGLAGYFDGRILGYVDFLSQVLYFIPFGEEYLADNERVLRAVSGIIPSLTYFLTFESQGEEGIFADNLVNPVFPLSRRLVEEAIEED